MPSIQNYRCVAGLISVGRILLSILLSIFLLVLQGAEVARRRERDGGNGPRDDLARVRSPLNDGVAVLDGGYFHHRAAGRKLNQFADPYAVLGRRSLLDRHIAAVRNAFAKIGPFGRAPSLCAAYSWVAGLAGGKAWMVRASHRFATSTLSADAPLAIDPSATQANAASAHPLASAVLALVVGRNTDLRTILGDMARLASSFYSDDVVGRFYVTRNGGPRFQERMRA
jgi:hypothetical protein